jgi:phosphoribosylformylglycinamidine synthase I
VDACRAAGMDARPVLWSEPQGDLRNFDAYVLPGGFAHEDRVRAGAIAARSQSLRVIAEEAQRGKFVLGICNGAQMLAEAGLLGPIALARNLPAGHFQCRLVEVELTAPPARCALTAAMPAGLRVPMAMAHGEGRFTGDRRTFEELERQGRIIFRYVGGAPNGSLCDAAGVCNEEGNILALMPHPERVAWNYTLAFARPELRADPLGLTTAHAVFAALATALRAIA